MSTVEQVLKLKRALGISKNGDSSEETKIAHSTNRGHKLEQGARFVSSRTLDVPVAEYSDSDAEEHSNYDSDSTDKSLKVDVAEILQPISDPAEVSSHPATKQIFLNPFLKSLLSEVLDDLVDEKDILSQVVKLLSALLGDDDLELIPQIMGRLDEHQPYPTPEPGQPLPVVKEDPNWFFQPPKLIHDPDHGLGPEEAQELREKLQVVQQQMEEYVRCMTQVRLDLLKTHRLRRQVLNWCREMNNEDYLQADLDEQNNYDNAGLGEQPAKDIYQTRGTAPQYLSNGLE